MEDKQITSLIYAIVEKNATKVCNKSCLGFFLQIQTRKNQH